MIKITSPLWDDYMYRLNDPSRQEAIFNYTASWGSIKIITIHLTDIRLFVIEFNSIDAYPVMVEVNALSLILNFTLSGQSQPGTDGPFGFCASKHQGLVSNGHLKLPFVLQGHLKLFTVCFLENSLKKSFPVALNDELLTPFKAIRPITTQMSQVIQGIENSIGQKGHHRIYFEAKALELLFLKLEQLENPAIQSEKSFLKEQDLERIHQAKIIVEENLLNPCSLIELAHKVGLNDFKLKKGFREVLGTTVFGYLYDLRMEKAKTLLRDGRSVREVAYEVGYKNAHHFTTAFKKKFGYLPSKANRLIGVVIFILSLIDGLSYCDV